jgi:hypothetical protein
LLATGVPIDRMNVGFRILHPLFDGMSITWIRESGADVSYAKLVSRSSSGSPLRGRAQYLSRAPVVCSWHICDMRRLRLQAPRHGAA